MIPLPVLAYKVLRRAWRTLAAQVWRLRTAALFAGNGVRHHDFRTNGVPYVNVARGGTMTIGHHFKMNNDIAGNPIGCYQRCTFVVAPGCTLSIGDNVGISQSALIAHADIVIEKSVKMGGVIPCTPLTSTHLTPRFVRVRRTRSTRCAPLFASARGRSSAPIASSSRALPSGRAPSWAAGAW